MSVPPPPEPGTQLSWELIDAWFGEVDCDEEWRPGEESSIDGADAVALEAARRFRDVLGTFASGVTVVTAVSDGEPVGLTCQSFSSVSLDPPLVLFVPARTSRAWPRIEAAGRFCVNVLAHDQEDLSARMAGRGTDKFAGLEWAPSAITGSPLLPGALGYVDCVVETVHDGGDHVVVIGRVVDLAVGRPGKPLLFYRGRYDTTRRATPERP